MILFIFLSSLFIYTSFAHPVQPLFSCWFPTYENGLRIKNLVFGYNNSGDHDTTLLFTSQSNTLTPTFYNGQQPDIYKIGHHPFEFALKDSQLLGGNIVWFLDQALITVNLENDIKPENLCSTLYHDTCAVRIEHFCEDSSYCNGEETCFSTAVFGVQTPNVMGVCSPVSVGITCTEGTLCNETSLSCHEPITDAPTNAPTDAPTNTPTEEVIEKKVYTITPFFECWYSAVDDHVVTGEEPVIIKYIVFGYNNSAPISQIIPVTTDKYSALMEKNMLSLYNGQQPILFLPGYHQSAFILADKNGGMNSINTRLDWFLTDRTTAVNVNLDLSERRLCNAPPTPTVTTQCSISNTDCSMYNSYCHGPSICNTETNQCIYSNIDYSPCPVAPQNVPLEIACIEHLSQCAQFILCTSDSECNDGLLCNGMEYCNNGSCIYQNDTSSLAICGGPNLTCIEGRGCVSDGFSISNGTITVIIMFIGFFIILLAVAIVFVYYYYNTKEGKEKNK